MTEEEKRKLGEKLGLRGQAFQNGTETGTPDPDAAILWYERAIRLGYIDAMNNLGVAYLAKKDYEQAYHWFLEAALGGEKGCLYNMGNLYYHGQYVDQDKAKAYRLFREAYQGGVKESCFYMGYYAEYGLFQEKDLNKAAQYYREGVSYQSAACACNLGRMYSLGIGVPWDTDKGREYSLLAYKWGSKEVCRNLGFDYERGFGIEPDMRKAVAYYKEGVRRGDESCREALEKMKVKGVQIDGE